ncbi:MAG: hypothetical protein Q8L07_04200 [Sediminibacterium sp.]|nr:hypothetical protein [Sediminibacterium sp.]
MRKYLLLTLISLAATFSLRAQSNQLTPAIDTSTNAQTRYIVTGVQNGQYQTFSIQFVKDSVSGTVAGYALIQASIDNSHWKDVNTDTFTFTNTGSQNYLWDLTKNKYLYYRIKVVTTGTQVSTNKGYLWRKE